MQTFLPYESFTESAKSLDRQRLGKQRVEAYQILRAIQGESKGWVNHPATKMWRDHPLALTIYGIKMCDEWISRGYKDTLRERFQASFKKMVDNGKQVTMPDLVGNPKFHLSHQSNLIRKLPEHYQPLFGDVPNDLPYIWEKDE